jgi:hypothetical protein
MNKAPEPYQRRHSLAGRDGYQARTMLWLQSRIENSKTPAARKVLTAPTYQCARCERQNVCPRSKATNGSSGEGQDQRAGWNYLEGPLSLNQLHLENYAGDNTLFTARKHICQAESSDRLSNKLSARERGEREQATGWAWQHDRIR